MGSKVKRRAKSIGYDVHDEWVVSEARTSTATCQWKCFALVAIGGIAFFLQLTPDVPNLHGSRSSSRDGTTHANDVVQPLYSMDSQPIDMSSEDAEHTTTSAGTQTEEVHSNETNMLTQNELQLHGDEVIIHRNAKPHILNDTTRVLNSCINRNE